MLFGYEMLVKLNPVKGNPQGKQQFELAGVKLE